MCNGACGVGVPIPTLPVVFATTTLGVDKSSLVSSKAKYVLLAGIPNAHLEAPGLSNFILLNPLEA